MEARTRAGKLGPIGNINLDKDGTDSDLKSTLKFNFYRVNTYFMSLKDKVVVITGGGSGIGRAMCRLFADRGAKVVVAEIDEEKGEEVVRTIKEAKGDASFVKVDVKEPEEVKALIDRTIENFGRLDVLINNAGIMSELASFTRLLWTSSTRS